MHGRRLLSGAATRPSMPKKEMTRSWESIRRHYQGISDLHPPQGPSAGMLRLVDAIMASRYAGDLHAWTSVWDLCIAQTSVSYPYDGPRLVIAPIENGKLDFRYVDTCKKDEQWHRVADESEGFNRLENFFDQLHWFL
jgi:hypothetical protein